MLLLRHGETQMSARGLYCGLSDPPLSARGHEQAIAWRAPFQAQPPAASYSSGLDRARSTAQLAGLATSRVLEDLHEWDLGLLEGQHAQSVRARNPQWSLYRDGPLGGAGESATAVTRRAHGVLEVVRPQEGLVVVVSHGQFIRVLAMAAVGLPTEAGARFSIGPGRCALLLNRTSGWSIAGWNLGAPAFPGGLEDLE